MAAERVVRLGGPQNRHGSGLATSSSSSMCIRRDTTGICIYMYMMYTRIDGGHGWTDGFLDARLECGRDWREAGGGGEREGVVELREWNNQARIKRPLVPYAGTSPLPPPSGRTIQTRDNYCNYSARNSRARKDTLSRGHFHANARLARFHVCPASCARNHHHHHVSVCGMCISSKLASRLATRSLS